MWAATAGLIWLQTRRKASRIRSTCLTKSRWGVTLASMRNGSSSAGGAPGVAPAASGLRGRYDLYSCAGARQAAISAFGVSAKGSAATQVTAAALLAIRWTWPPSLTQTTRMDMENT